MNISVKHKAMKGQAYWNALVHRETSEYDEQMVDNLLNDFFPQTCKSILDVGCGTGKTILKYKHKLKAETAVGIDYDTKVIEQMKADYNIEGVQWRVADVCNLGNCNEKYDLTFLLNVIHEVYSFYGRPGGDLNSPINHQLGLEYVVRVITNLARITNQGGGIVITDDVLCSQDVELKIRVKTNGLMAAVKYFLLNYPSRIINADFRENGILCINSRDFCVLLTQYNKIKTENWDRWNVECSETHQYMTLEEYGQMFSKLGFIIHAIVGTPDCAYREWCSDFEILDGLSDFPEKRITLLGVKS